MPDGMLAPMGDVKPSPAVKREDLSGGAAPHRPPSANGLSAAHNSGLRFASGGAGSADASPVSGLANGAHNLAASVPAQGPQIVSGAGPQKGAAAGNSTAMAAGIVTMAKSLLGGISSSGDTGGVPLKGPSQLSAAMMTATAENAGGGGAGLLAQMRATGTQLFASNPSLSSFWSFPIVVFGIFAVLASGDKHGRIPQECSIQHGVSVNGKGTY